MATANDIVSLALRGAGIVGQGQTAAAADINDGFTLLNQMLAQWQQAQFATLATVSTFTPEYLDAILWGLARRLRPVYQLDPDPQVDKLAAETLSLIRNETPPNWVNGVPAASDLVGFALRAARVVGVAETALPRDINDGFVLLNAMLAQWHATPFPSLATVSTFTPDYHDAIIWNLAARLYGIYNSNAQADDPHSARIERLASETLAIIRLQTETTWPLVGGAPTPVAQDLIAFAYRAAGILGDLNDGLNLLNMMLAQWQRQRWLVYHLREFKFVGDGVSLFRPMNSGDGSLGGSHNGAFNNDFNNDFTNGGFSIGAPLLTGARPDRIETAFARLIGSPIPVDFPLGILESWEDYSRVGLKTLASLPQYVFLDAGWPVANLYIWPIPTSQYEIHVLMKEVLQSFQALTTSFNMPPEYQDAIVWNLAVRLRAFYRKPPDPVTIELADDALRTIRAAYAQVPRIVMPRGLSRRGSYNIYSDNVGR
jgi:hypothetical protein